MIRHVGDSKIQNRPQIRFMTLNSFERSLSSRDSVRMISYGLLRRSLLFGAAKQESLVDLVYDFRSTTELAVKRSAMLTINEPALFLKQTSQREKPAIN